MSKHKRPVQCIELDLVFNSIKEAALELDLHEKCIWRCCNNLQKKTDKLSFKYYDLRSDKDGKN